jgi:hypothetical protein
MGIKGAHENNRISKLEFHSIRRTLKARAADYLLVAWRLDCSAHDRTNAELVMS